MDVENIVKRFAGGREVVPVHQLADFARTVGRACARVADESEERRHGRVIRGYGSKKCDGSVGGDIRRALRTPRKR